MLVQPAAFLLFQYLAGTTTLASIPSYADARISTLKQPLTTDPRYHCSSSANDAITGCNAVTRLQQLDPNAAAQLVERKQMMSALRERLIQAHAQNAVEAQARGVSPTRSRVQ